MQKILFLCTGNTCRSPMAECLFNHLSQERNLPFHAISAGISVTSGAPASSGARAAMEARGLSLLGHQAQLLTLPLLSEASLVIAVTPEHAEFCRERFPSATAPVRSFSPPIPDPFGGSLAVYEQTALSLDAQVSALIQELSTAEEPS